MSKKKKQNKKIRDSYGTVTLKELEEKGLVPKNFHLFDRIDMNDRTGRVVLRFKRPGRQVRWRVEWEDTRERTSFLGYELKPYIVSR